MHIQSCTDTYTRLTHLHQQVHINHFLIELLLAGVWLLLSRTRKIIVKHDFCTDTYGIEDSFNEPCSLIHPIKKCKQEQVKRNRTKEQSVFWESRW